MMQLATESVGVPFARPLNVSDIRYVYDIEHRSGLCMATIKVDDIAGAVVETPGSDMGETAVCPVSTGALVSSAAGGDIVGWDMYGQLVKETVSAAGTSTIAFAGIVDGPADMLWTNNFGLPYKLADDSVDTRGLLTYVPPSDTEDSRGTFSVDAGVTEPTDVQLYYTADLAQPMGAPYAERFASPEFNTQTLVITGTVDGDGLVTITIPSTGGAEIPCEVRYPDGFSEYVASGAVGTHTLSELWMSKYGRQIAADPQGLGSLVTVDPYGNDYAPVYVALTGTVAPTVLSTPTPVPPAEPEPDPEPAPATVPVVPASFTSHAQADEWLAAYVSATGFDEPDEWAGANLTTKRSLAQSLYEHWEADH